MNYTLPKLNYAYDALEPQIDAKTMEIHHTKHHQAYITNALTALDAHPELKEKDPVELLKNLNKVPDDIRAAVQNNVGGHVNHTLFWEILAPAKGQLPSTELLEAIARDFGSLDSLKAKIDTAAKTRFGSGWAWLVVTPEKTLDVISTANQDSPYSLGLTPILGIDVWEHAYYLNYQNRRPDYIQNWFEVINWDKVSELYNHAI
ncbi:superoxide dismutase [Erysipelothrix larvae]|uniref:Superoxide dismutase n=1 Tax=Erysipelothrix larvae TaxID=1514105 RepID=A0A0X8H1Y3_9FIRM|nr:superoxide dismutase [Erysipelothrix larvae]AMC94629.1 superoxide dismutase [Erysipelothrix larvae]